MHRATAEKLSMELYHHLLVVVAGMCFFMYGMMLASQNLQLIAADRVRALMSKLSDYQFMGILTGVALTSLLQSSSAVTVMLVNLASAGVVSLVQVMGVIIGSAIGTTVTVQLISFHVTAWAHYIVIVGFLILFLSKSSKVQRVGGVIFGFGLLFYGLLIMNDAISIVKDIQGFKEAFKYLSANPFTALIATTIFTAFIHSSAVTLGLAMTLTASGLISLYDSMYWVYGANLGTTATALFASLRGGYVGRQVAWAHFLFKFVSVTLFLFVTTYFVDVVVKTSPDAAHQVANAHTLLNIVSAIVFFPFIKVGARFVERLFPRPASEKEFGARYLDAHAFKTPAKAYANATREMLRMADYTLEMLRLTPKAFEVDDLDYREDIRQIDKKVDTLNRETKMYLVRLSHENLTENQQTRVVNLIALVSDIENIGDVIDKSIMELARKKAALKVSFSEEGWREVCQFHGRVVENFETALSAFSLNNIDLAQKVVRNKHEIRILEKQLRAAHIQRLHMNMKASLNTSNIHLDLLSSLRRVNSYVCNLVYVIIDSEGQSLFPSDDAACDPDEGTNSGSSIA